MTATNEHDVKVLNDLIATTLDSADGYSEASKDAKSSQLAGLFRDRAAEREQVVGKLQQRVAFLGGKPEDSGTVLASAHRMFINLRNSLSKSDEAVIDEVERGEDVIKKKYEMACEDTDLPMEAKTVVTEAYVSVKADTVNFAGPGTTRIPASKVSWTATPIGGGTGSPGTLSSAAYSQVYVTGNNKSAAIDITWTLASIAAAGLRAGTHTLTIRWKLESIGP